MLAFTSKKFASSLKIESSKFTVFSKTVFLKRANLLKVVYLKSTYS